MSACYIRHINLENGQYSPSVSPKYSGWIAGMVIGKSIYKVEFCRELKVFFFALRSPLLYLSLPELVRFSCLNNYGNWECSLVTLLSSMTVFKDSIHIGSISPSSTIHLGLSLLIEARSRMIVENKPAKKQTNIESATHYRFPCRRSSFSKERKTKP